MAEAPPKTEQEAEPAPVTPGGAVEAAEAAAPPADATADTTAEESSLSEELDNATAEAADAADAKERPDKLAGLRQRAESVKEARCAPCSCALSHFFAFRAYF
jgi:hypothetical protein